MSPSLPTIMFMGVVFMGLAAGALFDRLAGPSWPGPRFSGWNRSMITHELVGIAGAFIGYHIALLNAISGGARSIAALLGAAVVLFTWRMIK